MKNLTAAVALSLLIVVGNASCALRILEKDPAPTIHEEKTLPYKVAILPFANKTSNPEAGPIMRKMFYNFFSSLNYHDLEAFVIDENLKSNQLYADITSGKKVSPQKLGQLLGVDAVIFGDVTALGKIYALVYTDTQPIWELEHTIHIEEGDVPLSPIGLATTVFKTALSHSQATHLKAASELSMQMIATMPNPPGRSEPPPKIQVLVHNGAGKLLQPGDTIKIVMIGEKNRIASWSLPPLISNRPMKEKRPGVYIGAYRIRAQDRLAHGRMVGILRTPHGVGSQWMDTLGPIIVGKPAVLPAVIAKDYVLSPDKSPYLVNGALVVKPGVKLTMKAGTVVWFRNLGLIVKGQLEILGTRDNPVRLSALGESSWKGIFLEGSRGDNEINYCHISGAEFGFRASKSRIAIKNCQFQDNIWGIVMEESRGEIAASLIRTSAKSGIAARKANLVVKGSVITENSTGGFLLEGSKAKIEQNNILNNGAWEIKVLDKKGRVKAAKNWWGDKDPAKKEIIGPVAYQPALASPINFSVVE
jgi:hypothetical protein